MGGHLKNSYYFSHDTNASRDEKILAMRVDYGWEGYGLFWAIIEAMAEATNYKLRFANGEPDNIDVAGLALNFRVSRKKLEKFVENCIKKYKLFYFSKNKKYFFSKTLRRRLSMRNKKTDKLRVAGKKGAKKRWNNDSHPNSHPNGKEIKGKERKGNIFLRQDSKESPDSDNIKIAYKATCYLIDKILANNPRARVPNKDPTDSLMKKWVYEMEKLNRLGPVGVKKSEHKGYNWKEIKKIINWCQDDNFWKSNILSTVKLREKIVTLENKMGVSKPKISMEESLKKMEEEDG